ncbi:LacI family DNA-binding transcriptional regulator [Burkholderia multivorans]|uniref:LacI family DNA-binding transcriptional regulator n=1 Tax=Burkholderia multivorans TaxID=87883 RepID=UPI0012DF8F18|nr:LacI family DNA-binding transcriptional regulator [Burkholderia multivorans]MBU9338372.1 LacI family DNA-binding transcriptional regulator [Burkholderia multivorans]MCA8139159.1 LacI family DNA-binding transcriptional regulator [Burkholderia multivorans]MCO1363409.1 LacI family DNA-binding transcriptional regulator [Burkholderia multivorans]MCO1379550.1 LacI family DNA-binding transcriptional regulator [Burkholderia multivorans]QGR63040.1 LacI family DNA-binding transcriptional regulator [B
MARHTTGRKSTIYDIAKTTGASTSTVSMVLNGTWARYRIKEETANRILACAEALGYNVNLSARGLRLSRSGLAGMIIPHYRNRFFAGLAETFEDEARRRGLCPIVVGTQRDPAVESSVTQTLLAQRVEWLFVAGVRDPAPLNALCDKAGVPSINLDLPGPGAPSIVSDNRGGARALADRLIDKVLARGESPAELILLGGFAGEYATEMRIAGFRDAFEARRLTPPAADAIECCGYSPDAARQALARRYAALGRLPAGMLMNSITAFEGLVRFASGLPWDIWQRTAVGCFDWDPFAARLPFDVTMLRQDVQKMIAEAFALLDAPDTTPHPTVMVPTRFMDTLDDDTTAPDDARAD